MEFPAGIHTFAAVLAAGPAQRRAHRNAQRIRMNVVRHVVVRGRVQGVGFRAFVEDEARLRGIAGWVRNRRDGAVEAVFSGDADAVAGMIAACREGPYGARVDRFEEREATADELALSRGKGLSVLPTI
jgi:acylphosphatase